MSATKPFPGRPRGPLAPLLPLLLPLLLGACSDSDVKEVQDWMAQVKKETKVRVDPIAPPKTFIPFAYARTDATDPYNPEKLLAELARVAAKSVNPLKPDDTRRRELLETYPLDTMRMVGTLNKGGVMYGLVRIDATLHKVRPGQRIAQNFGVITAVGEEEIDLREVVQDAAGEWVERMSKLELQVQETGK
ncbi:pilus assembly protein PilP [Massilia glaciei]|uniref:Pilus assembly protein PilP n=2 Tax=Massilia glaciei TaxID=1524097 RepID=A0A2U2I4U9_9BURK|nr:pilus assembly protein PilP [Massilia glaciei]